MSENEKKRKIGSNMKPRGQQVPEENTDNSASTDEGQLDTAEEVVSETPEVPDTGVNLSPNSGEDVIANSSCTTEPEVEVSVPPATNLSDLLRQSAEVEEEVAESKQGNNSATQLAGIEIVKEIPKAEAEVFLKKIQATAVPSVGPRPDGTYGLVVTIGEGLIDAIRGQAEADGVAAEEWVSVRLGEYLESWWMPAKGR